MVNICLAFLKRDFQDRMSYRSAMLFDLGGVLLHLITFFYIQKLFVASESPHLIPYGGSYFAFVIVGLAFSNYQSTALNSFSTSLRQEQLQGTLEAILQTPTRIETVMLAGSLWNFTLISLKIFSYFVFGVIFFNLDLSHINWLSCTIILTLAIVTLSSLGLFSAGYILVHQKGDPVNFVFNSTSRFFAGVYFPITLLPFPIKYISNLIPLTHVLSAMRESMLNGASLGMITTELCWLIGYSLILLPTGIYYFRRSLLTARRKGSLIFI